MNSDNKTAGQEMVFDKYVAIALVVGIIAGFIIGHSVGASKVKINSNATSTSDLIYGENGATSSSSMMDDDDIKGGAMMSGDKVSVSNQKAGNTVVVSKLNLDKSYWVAVRDSRSTNVAPRVLGAKKIMAGSHSDVAIYVSRATEAGKSYDVVLFKDAPDFNYSASMMVMDGTEPVGATFKAN